MFMLKYFEIRKGIKLEIFIPFDWSLRRITENHVLCHIAKYEHLLYFLLVLTIFKLISDPNKLFFINIIILQFTIGTIYFCHVKLEK